MQQKTILIFLIIFLITSFSWLAYIEKKQHQIKNQWFLYFQNPTADADLDFIIENYTNDSDFTWQLLNNENIIKAEKVKVLKGDKKTVNIKLLEAKQIKVLHNKESKLIYK